MPELQGIRGRRVLREMQDNDPVIGALLFAIEMLIRQVDWQIEPGSDSPEDQEIADFIDECRDDMAVTWPDTLAEILSFLAYGWGVHELLYKRRDGRNSKHDDGKIAWHSWPIRGQETLLRWQFDDMYQPTAMIQLGPPDYIEHIIPLEKALLFRTTTKRNSPEGRSILRNAYRPWYYKKHIEAIEGIGIERDLAGLPVAEVPVELLAPNATADETATLAAIKKIVTNIRRDEQEGIVWPRAYDPDTKQPLYELKLLSTGGTRQFDTDKIIARYDQRMAMTVLADFIMLGHENVGSQSLGETKTNLFTVALGAWLASICAVVNDQAIPRLLKLNGMQPDQMPTLTHGDIERADLNELGNYLLHLSQAGVEIDGAMTGPLAKRAMKIAKMPEPDTDSTPVAAKWDQQTGTTHVADAGQQAAPEATPQPPAGPTMKQNQQSLPAAAKKAAEPVMTTPDGRAGVAHLSDVFGALLDELEADNAAGQRPTEA